MMEYQGPDYAETADVWSTRICLRTPASLENASLQTVSRPEEITLQSHVNGVKSISSDVIQEMKSSRYLGLVFGLMCSVLLAM